MKSEWLSSLKMWMRASVWIRNRSTWKMVTFRACADQLSRNVTDILQLLEAYQRIISTLGTNWTCHIEKNLFKPKIHLTISATFYLAGFTLCIEVWVSGLSSIYTQSAAINLMSFCWPQSTEYRVTSWKLSPRVNNREWYCILGNSLETLWNSLETRWKLNLHFHFQKESFLVRPF